MSIMKLLTYRNRNNEIEENFDDAIWKTPVK